MMAAADTLQVTVHGRGGHGSQPHLAADPVPAACEIVTALQTLVTRQFDVFDPVVITVGSFHAGTADNVIPDEARTRGHGAVVLAGGAGAGHGGRAAPGGRHRLGARAVGHGRVRRQLPGDGQRRRRGGLRRAGHGASCSAASGSCATPNPVTGSEDFSFVLEQVPGAFVMLGACPPDADPATAPFNHSAEAVFDDAVLADGTTLLAELALRRLAAG